MRNELKLCMILVIVVLLLSSCENKKNDTVEIIGSDVTAPEPVINVSTEALEIESERKWVTRLLRKR